MQSDKWHPNGCSQTVHSLGDATWEITVINWVKLNVLASFYLSEYVCWSSIWINQQLRKLKVPFSWDNVEVCECTTLNVSKIAFHFNGQCVENSALWTEFCTVHGSQAFGVGLKLIFLVFVSFTGFLLLLYLFYFILFHFLFLSPCSLNWCCCQLVIFRPRSIFLLYTIYLCSGLCSLFWERVWIAVSGHIWNLGLYYVCKLSLLFMLVWVMFCSVSCFKASYLLSVVVLLLV